LTYYHGAGAVGGHLLGQTFWRDAPERSAGVFHGAAIDDAVWSYWSTPYTAYQHRNWLNDRSHLLAWVLSVRTARSHFRRASLVTDDAGADLLVNRWSSRSPTYRSA
jgi:hypothetical protein